MNNNYLRTFLFTEKKSIVIFILLTISYVFLENVSVGLLIPLLNFIISPTDSSHQLKIGFITLRQNANFILLIILLAILLKNLLDYIRRVQIYKMSSKTIADLRKEIFSSLMELNLSYFISKKTGDLINNISGETRRAGLAIQLLLDIIVNLMVIIAYISFLFYLSVKTTLFFALSFLIILSINHIILKKAKKLGVLKTYILNDLNSFINECIQGIKLVKIYNKEGYEVRRFHKIVKDDYDNDYSGGRYTSMAHPVTQILATFVLIFIIFILFNFIKVDLLKKSPYIFAYFVIILRLIPIISTFNTERTRYLIMRGGLDSVCDIIEAQKNNIFINGTLKLTGFKKSIKFDNVNFSYPDSKFGIKDFSVEIEKNHIVAIVGPSGAGKSTIIDLICRFYDPQKGYIYIDTYPLRELDIYSWRSRMAIVSQETVLFNDTIRNNIAFSKENASDEEIILACKKAYCHDFIIKLPEGYSSVIGERGVKLSGGQRQRLSIARAFLRNPEVLILDEATSSLDSESEQYIYAALGELMKGKTVIVIAHRLSTIQNADKIIVIDNGEIVTHGTHEELLVPNTLYWRLYNNQILSAAST